MSEVGIKYNIKFSTKYRTELGTTLIGHEGTCYNNPFLIEHDLSSNEVFLIKKKVVDNIPHLPEIVRNPLVLIYGTFSILYLIAGSQDMHTRLLNLGVVCGPLFLAILTGLYMSCNYAEIAPCSGDRYKTYEKKILFLGFLLFILISISFARIVTSDSFARIDVSESLLMAYAISIFSLNYIVIQIIKMVFFSDEPYLLDLSNDSFLTKIDWEKTFGAPVVSIESICDIIKNEEQVGSKKLTIEQNMNANGTIITFKSNEAALEHAAKFMMCDGVIGRAYPAIIRFKLSEDLQETYLVDFPFEKKIIQIPSLRHPDFRGEIESGDFVLVGVNRITNSVPITFIIRKLSPSYNLVSEHWEYFEDQIANKPENDADDKVDAGKDLKEIQEVLFDISNHIEKWEIGLEFPAIISSHVDGTFYKDYLIELYINGELEPIVSTKRDVEKNIFKKGDIVWVRVIDDKLNTEIIKKIIPKYDVEQGKWAIISEFNAISDEKNNYKEIEPTKREEKENLSHDFVECTICGTRYLGEPKYCKDCGSSTFKAVI